ATDRDSGSQPNSGTDSNRAAITTLLPGQGDSVVVDDSFVIDDGRAVSVPKTSDTTHDDHAAITEFGAVYWQGVARIGVQVAKALSYAHRQGTLHRDIKPANLLIDEGGTVWVADFGLAKAMEHDNVSRTGDIVGTLRYMAPELFVGTADARSDIYSLGLTLYELLTLTPAFDETQRKRSFLHDSGPLEPQRPRRDHPSIPRDLETIVLKAIAAEPTARYQTAAELSEDLQRFLEDRPILARRASVAERLFRWARRNPAVATLSGLAVSLLLLVAVVSTTAYFRTKQAKDAAVTANANERQQRLKAEATSNLAWNALDRIFERLAPHRYASPEDFAVDTEESGEFNFNAQPVLSDESAALMDEMLVFYRKLAAQGDDSAEFRQRIAEANRRVGDIRQRLGQYGQAKQAYRQAIEVYAQLANDGTTNPKQAAALASIYNELGEVFRSSHQYDQSRDAFDTARSILEPIATKSSPPEVRYELARSFYLRVRRFDGRPDGGGGPANSSRGGPRGSEKGGPRGNEKDGPPRPPGEGFRPGGQRGHHFPDFRRDAENIERAITLLEELNAEHDVPDYQQLLALCYAERHRHSRDEDRDRSDEAMAKAIGLLEDLVSRFPRNPDYRFTLSKVYTPGFRGFERPSESELAEMETKLLTAVKLLEDLHREHPGVPDYLLSQLNIRPRLIFLYAQSNRFEEAHRNFQETIRLQKQLSDRDSSGPRFDPGSGWLLDAYSRRLVAQFRAAKDANEPLHPEWLTEVRDLFTHWIEMMGPVVESDPNQRRFVGFAYRRLATINTLLGDSEAARVATENMKKILPPEEWEDIDRREGSGPPGGPGGPRNPNERPPRFEQPPGNARKSANE
ncbi:MAG: serine/threonine-protein kinase, partial [Planctomycetota bacterium]